MAAAEGGHVGGVGDKLEMTIRPWGGNLHVNRSRPACVCVHSARIDVRGRAPARRACVRKYKPRARSYNIIGDESPHRFYRRRVVVVVADRAACGRHDTTTDAATDVVPLAGAYVGTIFFFFGETCDGQTLTE